MLDLLAQMLPSIDLTLFAAGRDEPGPWVPILRGVGTITVLLLLQRSRRDRRRTPEPPPHRPYDYDALSRAMGRDARRAPRANPREHPLWDREMD
jgi:hypothetical protein